MYFVDGMLCMLFRVCFLCWLECVLYVDKGLFSMLVRVFLCHISVFCILMDFVFYGGENLFSMLVRVCFVCW